MKDFMINVSDVTLHVSKPHVLREKDKLSDKNFDFVKNTLANQMQKAENSDEILAYAYEMVKNEQRRNVNSDRNFHIDRNEKLIGRMKAFIMQNLRSDTIVTRKLLRGAFCEETGHGIFANDDYREVMRNVGYAMDDIEATTVIDEALRDLVGTGQIKKVKFVDHVNYGRIKTGYMLVEDDF